MAAVLLLSLVALTGCGQVSDTAMSGHLDEAGPTSAAGRSAQSKSAAADAPDQDDGAATHTSDSHCSVPPKYRAMWRPLVQKEAHFHLEVDSALGAFYDVTDAGILRPFFDDDLHMMGVFDRALAEKVVTMEAQGRVVAVVFECPHGSGSYPVYAGFKTDGKAVAVLVDLEVLSGAERRVA